MNLIIIKHINCLLKYKDKFLKAKLIFSLDYRATYILKKKNFKVIECEDVIPENKLKNIAKNSDFQIENILRIFNEKLFLIENFYKHKNWRIFNNFLKHLKTKVDILIYLNVVIEKIIRKYKIKKIYYIKSDIPYEINFDNSNYSSLDYVLKNNENFKKIKKNLLINKEKRTQINYFDLPNEDFNSKITIFDYKNFIKKIIFFLKPILNNQILFINFDKNHFLFKKFKINFLNFYIKIKKKKKFFYKNNLNINKKFTINNGLKLSKIYNNYFYKNLGEILPLKKSYNFYFNKIKNIKLIVFKYSGYPFLLSILLKKICDDLKIFNFVWSHGAWGFHKSLGGYQYTDLFLSKNIANVGHKPKTKFKNKINFFNLGYLNYSKNRHILKKKKKTILIIGGFKYDTSINNIYFGYYRKGCLNSLWRDNLIIIKSLLKYSDDYEIIYKDYGYGDKFMKNIIQEVSLNKIKYIYDEVDLKYLMSISHLNIFMFASTSFLESLNFKSDSIVIEPDLRNDLNILKKMKNHGIFFFKDIKNAKKFIAAKLNKKEFIFSNKKYLQEKYFCNEKKITKILN